VIRVSLWKGGPTKARASKKSAKKRKIKRGGPCTEKIAIVNVEIEKSHEIGKRLHK